MTANVSRRVSYILPTPTEPPPWLDLPALGDRRRGVTSPYLVPKANDGTNGHTHANGNGNDPFASNDEPVRHPRHCLGITSLALDTSTVLADSSAPGGILYTGGRDGLVASWDLGIAHRRRRGGRYEVQPGRSGRVRWEKVGDGAEMWDSDEEDEEGQGGYDYDDDEWESEEEDISTDGWIGVDAERIGEGLKRRRAARGEVPYEDRWEVDSDALGSSKVSRRPTAFVDSPCSR